ncbi:MAG: hypothetical protein C4522_17270 [Desulfobacteraceae bacterium]|nr:MAG: hypothetical protein C4522_17270 [Desulfobacteraceae bacterium]
MRDGIRIKMALAIILILGLSTPGLSGEPSKFDSGNQGTSALGQLEDVAGQKVDRSSPGVSTIDTYKKKITLPQKAVAKPKVNHSAAMNAMVTDVVVGSLLQAVFSDDSQQRAYEEAARAMVEAEQKRLAEEQRRQRLDSAGKLRSFWDGRDEEMSKSLDDVFSLPGQGQGTPFFGMPGNPVVKPSDPSVGQLSQPLTTETSALQDGIMKSGAEYVQEAARDSVKDIVKDVIKGALPASARNAELMIDYVDKMNEFTGNLFQAIDPNRLVGTLANEGPGDYHAIMNDLNKVTRQGTEIGLGESPFSDSELQTGFHLLRGKGITAADAKVIATGRWKGYLSDKLKDRLTDGWM